MQDLLGQAIADLYHHRRPGKLWVHDTFGPKVEMPVATYFRHADAMPELERAALACCRGKVLDIGAGAGSHALLLQERGFDVTALDISPAAATVMQERGVQKVCAADIFGYDRERYDTLLLLMNGIGLCGTIEGLRRFLRHAATLMLPGGQLLFDSSDVAYLYEDGIPPDEVYYGTITCRYEYKRQKTDWFSWLYIDRDTLRLVASDEGWHTEVITEDAHDQYLARLSRP